MTALYTHEIAPCEINLRYNLAALVIHVGRAVDKFKWRFNLALHTPDDLIRQHQKSAMRQVIHILNAPECRKRRWGSVQQSTPWATANH